MTLTLQQQCAQLPTTEVWASINKHLRILADPRTGGNYYKHCVVPEREAAIRKRECAHKRMPEEAGTNPEGSKNTVIHKVNIAGLGRASL
jgi:hypothetical protein